MSSCVLVIALLSASPSEPVAPVDPAEWPIVRAALFAQAVEWEILDPREDRLLRLEDFPADLAALRRRYQELKNAPPLADAQRFPDRNRVADLLRFNRAYRRGLDARQVVDRDRADFLKEAVREADELYRVWDLVREASCDIYYIPVRRAALKRLREALGEAAYHAGDLPPHVPLWRFIELH
jgi:hypothetical protein